MYKSRFLIGFLVFISLVVLMAVGSYALYQFGYSQGYTASLSLSAVEEGTNLVPPFGTYRPFGYWGFPRPFLLCFAGGVFLLAFFMILKTIRFLTWRSMFASDPEKWHRHWRGVHRHAPPGWYEEDKPGSQQSETNS